MLELAVVPEKSLSNDDVQLVLGMSLNQIIQSLQRQFEVIRSIEVSYSDKHPLSADIGIQLREDGIRLLFDPHSQRLKLIEVTDLNKVSLSYCGTVFCSREILPTRAQIDDTFGATHPGEFDADASLFHLKFRGLCFSFAADRCDRYERCNGLLSSKSGYGVAKVGGGFTHNNLAPTPVLGSNSLDGQGHFSSIVSRMAIYSGTSHKTTIAPQLPLSSFGNSIFLDHLGVLRDPPSASGCGRTRGVQLEIILRASVDRTNMPAKRTLKRRILFGDSVSDVVSAVGSPSKIFYKEEDKMRIHSPSVDDTGSVAPHIEKSDYFYNYFTLGMDILFDARLHIAKKIILHTNFPGHYDFNSYHRCNFTMVLPSLVDGESSVTVTTYSKWDEIADQLVAKDERPVVLTRGGGSHGTSLTSSSNPFGPTYCFGCCGDMIIEVISQNNHIASVTFFDSTFIS